MKNRLLAAMVAFGIMGSTAWATSIYVQGTITSVKDDGSGYTVKGYDHYNARRYENKIAEIPVKIANFCAFVLDNRIVDRKLVLASGRKSYAIGSSAGAMMVVALSEPADRDIGEVVAVDGGTLKLKVSMGADAMEIEVPMDVAAAKQATALTGKTVRVLPARQQTVLAFSEAALAKIPPQIPVAVSGVLKDKPEALVLMTWKDGKAVEFKPDVRKAEIVMDVRGFPGHGATDLLGNGPGCPATEIAYFKRPGKLDARLVLQAPDAGRVDGVIKSLSGDQLVVTALTADGTKDVTVMLAGDAVVKVDGKDSATGALTPGLQVSVFTARPQTVEACPLSADAAH